MRLNVDMDQQYSLDMGEAHPVSYTHLDVYKRQVQGRYIRKIRKTSLPDNIKIFIQNHYSCLLYTSTRQYPCIIVLIQCSDSKAAFTGMKAGTVQQMVAKHPHCLSLIHI